MRKFSLLVVVFTVLMSCSKDDINGSGILISEMREVDYFTKVASDGVFNVTITQGETQSLEVIADTNVIHKVNTEVVDNELRLYLDDGNYQGVNLEVNIVALRINALKNSGIGNMFIYNVDENGTLKVNNSGSANILIEGSSASLDIYNEGSGIINGFGLSVNDCSLEIQGSGDIEVNCSDNLNVKIDGTGNVYYIGNPTIEADINGSGRVVNVN